MWKEQIKNRGHLMRIYLFTFVKWVVIALILGGICGLVGPAFLYAVQMATSVRQAHFWLILLLPFAGLLIVAIYRLHHVEKDEGTNLVLSSVRKSHDLPGNMSYLIFIGTVLTHLCGGSAGREGAALQIGGSIGSVLGRLLHLDENEKKMIITVGMAGMFSALFGTPLAAAVFSMEVILVGSMNYAIFLPGLVAAVTANHVSGYFVKEGFHYVTFAAAGFDLMLILKVGGIAVVCALTSWIFIHGIGWCGRMLTHFFPNSYLRIFVGGCIIIILTLLCGSTMFNGAGTEVIAKALSGETVWYAFLLKILFTAVTIGAGFKGGEIVPSFFIGATLGCLMGGIFGMDPGFAAAVGMITLFCGVVNAPMASVMLSVELFGGGNVLYFALACAICFIVSGYSSLYQTQGFVFRKIPDGGEEHS